MHVISFYHNKREFTIIFCILLEWDCEEKREREDEHWWTTYIVQKKKRKVVLRQENFVEALKIAAHESG